MNEKRRLTARAEALEAELDSRRSVSQVQADYAVDRGTAREVGNATAAQVAWASRSAHPAAESDVVAERSVLEEERDASRAAQGTEGSPGSASRMQAARATRGSSR